MTEDEPFESELAAAAETVGLPARDMADLLTQLHLAQKLLAEAGEVTGPALVYRGRDGKTRIQPVEPEVRFGRGSECNLCLPGLREISRLHFSITKDEHGVYWLSDPGSLNGTYLRGRPHRITRCELADGDVIDAGGFAFLFVRE